MIIEFWVIKFNCQIIIICGIIYIVFSNFKSKFSPVINLVATPFRIFNPNFLSVLGVVPYVLFFLVLDKNLILALVVCIGFSFDFIDGTVARLEDKQSAFGGILDSTLDRFSDGLLIFSFANAELISWELAYLTFGFSFLVSYIRSRAELELNGSASLAVGLIERPERVILIIAALFLYVLFPHFLYYGLNISEIVFIVLLMLSIFTFLQRLRFSYRITSGLK